MLKKLTAIQLAQLHTINRKKQGKKTKKNDFLRRCVLVREDSSEGRMIVYGGKDLRVF